MNQDNDDEVPNCEDLTKLSKVQLKLIRKNRDKFSLLDQYPFTVKGRKIKKGEIPSFICTNNVVYVHGYDAKIQKLSKSYVKKDLSDLNDLVCCLCLSDYKSEDKIGMLPCTLNKPHYFHYECIVQSLFRDTRCPLCRYNHE